MSTLPEQENGPSADPEPQAEPATPLRRRSLKVPLLITGAVALTGVAGVAAYQATRPSTPIPTPATADWGTGDGSPSPSPVASSGHSAYGGHGGGWWFFHGGGWGGSSSSIGREASSATSRGGFGATSHSSGGSGSGHASSAS